MEDVETDGLLSRVIPFDLDVGTVPNGRPLHRVILSRSVPALVHGSARLFSGQSAQIFFGMIEAPNEAHRLGQDQTLAGLGLHIKCYCSTVGMEVKMTI